MEKITLKLYECYNLEAELNGLRNQSTGEVLNTGLLQEKLSLVTKYWLTDLAKKVSAEKTAIEELKNDLIKKYGKEDGKGGMSIPLTVEEVDADGEPVRDIDKDGNWFTKKIMNPAFEQFEKEFNELLQTEKELEYKSVSLSDLEKVETADNYAAFSKLVKVEADTPAK